MGLSKRKLPAIRCPNCGDHMHVRSSREVTLLCRDLYMICRNDECGGTYNAQLSIVNSIRASATPNPDIALPRSPRFHAPRPANDADPIAV